MNEELRRRVESCLRARRFNRYVSDRGFNFIDNRNGTLSALERMFKKPVKNGVVVRAVGFKEDEVSEATRYQRFLQIEGFVSEILRVEVGQSTRYYVYVSGTL